MSLTSRLSNIFSRASLKRDKPNGAYYSPYTRYADVTVTPDTVLTNDVVWRCVNLISGQIGNLDWNVFRKAGDSKELLERSPVQLMLNRRANPECNAVGWRRAMTASYLLWGNAYAEIERDDLDRPRALWFLPPSQVQVSRDDRTNEIIYIHRNGYGDTVHPARNIFHIKGLGGDAVTGVSVIGAASKSLGLAMSAEQHTANFFKNGAILGLLFKHPDKLSQDSFDNLKKSLDEKQGSSKAYQSMILEEGMDIEQIGIKPEDAQLLEARRFNAQQVARWFGVPPHKIGLMDQATFDNVEQQNISFATETLAPILKELEQEADFKLFRASNTVNYTRFDLKGLVRGDSKARGEFYKTMFNMGAMSINEIRQYEDMNPIENGENHFLQLNLQTLDRALEDPQEDEIITLPALQNNDDEPEEDQEEKIEQSINTFVSKHYENSLYKYVESNDGEAFAENVNSFFSKYIVTMENKYQDKDKAEIHKQSLKDCLYNSYEVNSKTLRLDHDV